LLRTRRPFTGVTAAADVRHAGGRSEGWRSRVGHRPHVVRWSRG